MNIITDIVNWLSKLFQWWVIIMPWERGLRVRAGKKVTLLVCGIYLKLPIIDAIYVQTTRTRVVSLPVQTVTTRDGKTLSISASAGYTIDDIELLYNTLYQPEMTIANIVLGAVAEYVASHVVEECLPDYIEKSVTDKLGQNQFGIGNISIKIIGFAIVRTYRIINDTHWIPDGMRLDVKT